MSSNISKRLKTSIIFNKYLLTLQSVVTTNLYVHKIKAPAMKRRAKSPVCPHPAEKRWAKMFSKVRSPTRNAEKRGALAFSPILGNPGFANYFSGSCSPSQIDLCWRFRDVVTAVWHFPWPLSSLAMLFTPDFSQDGGGKWYCKPCGVPSANSGADRGYSFTRRRWTTRKHFCGGTFIISKSGVFARL